MKQKSYNEIYGGITGRAANLGLMVGVCIAICTFFGYYIDELYNLAPKGIVCGALFGVIAGFVNMIEQLNKISKKMDETSEKSKKQL